MLICVFWLRAPLVTDFCLVACFVFSSTSLYHVPYYDAGQIMQDSMPMGREDLVHYTVQGREVLKVTEAKFGKGRRALPLSSDLTSDGYLTLGLP